MPPLKYAPGCACLNVHSILVTAWNHSTSVFKSCGLLILFFFYKEFHIYVFRLVLKCLLVARKKNLTGVSTGLNGRSKNLDPTGRSTRPVSISETASSKKLWATSSSDNYHSCLGIFYDVAKKTTLWKKVFNKGKSRRGASKAVDQSSI